jgi:hypothetical protein
MSSISAHDMTWHDMTWHDMIWHDMTWHDMTWHDMTWHDISHQFKSCHTSSTHVMTCHNMKWCATPYMVLCIVCNNEWSSKSHQYRSWSIPCPVMSYHVVSWHVKSVTVRTISRSTACNNLVIKDSSVQELVIFFPLTHRFPCPFLSQTSLSMDGWTYVPEVAALMALTPHTMESERGDLYEWQGYQISKSKNWYESKSLNLPLVWPPPTDQ